MDAQENSPEEIIISNIRSVVNDLIHKLNSYDSIDYVRYRVDWLCSLLIRLGGNFEAQLLRTLQEVQRMVAILDNDIYYTDRYESAGQVTKIETGFKGRPSFDISKDHLEFFLEMGFKATDIAKMLAVSPKTVHRRLKQFGLSMEGVYSNISDSSLDSLIGDILNEFPNSGYRSMKGHLLSRGLKVQEHRIRKAMRRIDPEGVIVRMLQLRITHRRSYNVRAPLSLWHMDGNHKLIR